MGIRTAPKYANLFVGYVDEQIFNRFGGHKLKPELFSRYIASVLALQARRQGGGVRRVRSHPPPRAEKVCLEVTCSAENVNL